MRQMSKQKSLPATIAGITALDWALENDDILIMPNDDDALMKALSEEGHGIYVREGNYLVKVMHMCKGH